MAIYAFETITTEQALTIGALDIVTFAGRPAQAVSVTYNIPAAGPPSITITVEGRAVEFGMDVLEISERGGLDFAGDSRLLIGGAGNDPLMGMAEDDAIYGGQGDDTIVGQGGHDLMQGNAGNDKIYGGHDSDVIYGGQGHDTIRTGLGVPGEAGDFAQGNMGDDTIIGGSGDDTLLGGQGNDEIRGGEGADYISGDLGDDFIRGEGGANTLLGGAGADTLISGPGANVVSGGAGNDLITVAGGSSVDGGEGRDTIISWGPGKDIVRGGAGVDRFEFSNAGSARFADADEILDWSSDESLHFDQVRIQAARPDQFETISASNYDSALAQANGVIASGKAIYVAAQVGADVVVFADVDGVAANGADAAVILVGRSLADIDWGNVG